MALVNALTEAGRHIRDAFSPRGALVQRLAEVKARHEATGVARSKAIAAAQAEVDRLDEPRRRLERLRAEEYASGLAADREILEVENQLRGFSNWPKALRVFARDLERFIEAWSQPLEVREEHNRVTDQTTITNLKELDQRLEAIALMVRVRLELRDALWKLPPTALNARLAELRLELGQYDRDGLDLGAEEETEEAAPAG